jgi:gamma-glutamyl hercynylcysteine S-oxide synthase
MGIMQTAEAPPGGLLSSITACDLIAVMREFRGRTLDLVVDLDDEQMIGPRLAIVNPPLWEIGHVAWFAEFWILRHLRKQKPIIENGDRLYNSTDVAHDTRWELLLPPLPKTRQYMDEVIDRCVEYIARNSELTSEEFYFYLLATYHESMHAEALAYTRQTLGYPAPRFVITSTTHANSGGPFAGDVDVPGGTFLIGATPDFPFAFDNEKWAHAVEIKPFRIARAPVTNGEFLAFVEDGG